MNTKSQKVKNRKLSAILITVGLLLASGAVLGFAFQDKIKVVTADIVTDIENSDKPRFVVDTAKLSDWATFGNTWQDSNPITTTSAYQCIKGSNCNNLVEKCRMRVDKSNQACQKLDQYTADGCMVHAYYSSGSIDPDTAIADKLKRMSSFGDTPQKIGIEQLSMSTPEGNKEYQFYQYDTNNNQGDYKRGSAFGFIPLSDGHIEVQSVCWEPNQLDDTLPVLSAMRLEM